MKDNVRVFHKSLNVAVTDLAMRYWAWEKCFAAIPLRRAWACPSPCVWILSAFITSVGQDRQILPYGEKWNFRLTL